MKEKLCLFDVDETLVWAGSAAFKAFVAAFDEVFGVDCSKVVVQTSGRTDPAIHLDVIEQVLDRSCCDDELELLKNNYLSRLSKHLEVESEYRVLPGVLELLKDLTAREDYTLALQTGNFEQGARSKLAKGGLNDFFGFGGFGSDSSLRRELVDVAIQRAEQWLNLSLDRSSVYVIGDTPHDVKAGKDNHCKTIAVATGKFSVNELASSEPDVVLVSFEKLAETLSALGV